MPRRQAPPTRAEIEKSLERLNVQLKNVNKARTALVKREKRIMDRKQTLSKSLAAANKLRTISAARFVADCVWDKFNHKGTFMDMMQSACQDDAEDEVTTTFTFQHPNANVVQGMTNLVEAAQSDDDDDLYDFPEVFSTALTDIGAASEFNLGRIGGDCGGLQACRTTTESMRSDRVSVVVRLGRVGECGIWAGGEAAVVIPYDRKRYAALYAAAVETGKDDAQQ